MLYEKSKRKVYLPLKSKQKYLTMRSFFTLIILLFFISQAFAQEITWWNPATNEYPVVSGQFWSDEVQSTYHRLPQRAENKVRKKVWNLSKQSAGLSIRFQSNAKRIHIRYSLKSGISMPHMPATGVSGLDLYCKSKDGEWQRCWGTYSINTNSKYTFIIEENSDHYTTYGKEYQVFLPLYNEVDYLEIGVEAKSTFKPLPLRNEKPIVAYGTSICQGACATRPGMAWTNILERKLERPVINLGFSGNGRLEPELIDLMAEIEAKVYILDCLPNLNPSKDDTYQLAINAVKQLKTKHPHTPVILTAHLGYANASNNKDRNTGYQKLNAALNKAFIKLQSEGYTKVFLLQNEDLAISYDAFVDGIHPNDIGMVQYANAYEKLIRRVIHEPIGQLSTTTPCTQRRDIAVYDWEERHQQILELNRSKAPSICLFGNSIINFWGGQPEISTHNGIKSWNKVMKPMGVRNFGFGWDRIENVLWRIYHDELDGFDAEQTVLMIGTNNLHLNTDDEIIGGLEAVIKAIRHRQPQCRIVMIGILPRNKQEQRVNALNLKISQMADIENVDYSDIGHTLLLNNGVIDQSLFIDGLHPNEKGYKIIAGQLKEVIKQSK